MKIITERTISRTDKVTERRILEIPDDDFIHFTREYYAQNEAKNPYCDEIQPYLTQKQGVGTSNLHFSEGIGREFDDYHDDIHDILYSGSIAENIYSDNISDIEFEARLAERREMIDHQRKIRHERKVRAEKRKRQRIYSVVQKTTGAALLAGTIAGGIMIQDITFGVITIPISLQEKRRKRVTTMTFIINFSIITFICFAVAKPAKTIIKSTINMFKEGEKA